MTYPIQPAPLPGFLGAYAQPAPYYPPQPAPYYPPQPAPYYPLQPAPRPQPSPYQQYPYQPSYQPPSVYNNSPAGSDIMANFSNLAQKVWQGLQNAFHNLFG